MKSKSNAQHYLEAAKQIEKFDIVIVGQDPYPSGANGIAFCKNTFSEFFDRYCCGKEVLFSLGYSKEYILENYDSPISLFINMLSEGIAFINVSSVLLKSATHVSLESDKEYNENFHSKANNIVVLGKSKATSYFEKYYPNYSITESLIHPSGLARKTHPKEWRITWSKPFLKTVIIPTFTQNKIKMELEIYFDLNIPSFQLYSKGDAAEGVHGIELINGEYYASHFHLKTKIAKAELKRFIENTAPKELYNKALKENTDFGSWPEVRYEGYSYPIKKYKFSWLMEHFKKLQ